MQPLGNTYNIQAHRSVTLVPFRLDLSCHTSVPASCNNPYSLPPDVETITSSWKSRARFLNWITKQQNVGERMKSSHRLYKGTIIEKFSMHHCCSPLDNICASIARHKQSLLQGNWRLNRTAAGCAYSRNIKSNQSFAKQAKCRSRRTSKLLPDTPGFDGTVG